MGDKSISRIPKQKKSLKEDEKMKYNKNTKTEQPINEMPYTCGECLFFDACAGGQCKANNCITPTFSFSRPADRPLPMPLNCYWWYANILWDRVSHEQQNKYAEERLHQFTAWEFMSGMGQSERRDFVAHLHRNGGGCLIDFNAYPEAKKIYDKIKEECGK